MTDDLFDLHGKTAIITGASRGLGKSMAIGLAKAGSNIVVTDVLDTKDTVDKIKEYDVKVLGIKVDVSDESDVEEMVKKTLEKFDSIDILVNNAGILRTDQAEDFSKEDWDKIIDVNLTGQFNCAKIVGKKMIKQGYGRIINISSIAGISGYATSVGYSASKAGVINLTKTLAAEWGEHKINVNAICPGVFATDMTDDYLKSEEFIQRINNNVPLKRYAKPEELVGTVIYLSSKASDYVTGHPLVIDGGWTCSI